jgi:hypothetical protein
MIRLVSFLILSFLFLSSQDMGAEEKSVGIWVFYTGKGFMDISKNNPKILNLEEFYVAGLNDGFNRLAGEYPAKFGWITKCTEGKQMGQLTTILKKWLNNNPKRWNEPAADLFLDAIKEGCK